MYRENPREKRGSGESTTARRVAASVPRSFQRLAFKSEHASARGRLNRRARECERERRKKLTLTADFEKKWPTLIRTQRVRCVGMPLRRRSISAGKTKRAEEGKGARSERAETADRTAVERRGSDAGGGRETRHKARAAERLWGRVRREAGGEAAARGPKKYKAHVGNT